MSRQLVLDLPHRAALGMADFLVAPSNEHAVAWLDRWPEWPHHALSIVGPEGSGKTHLAHVFAARANAVTAIGRGVEDIVSLGPGRAVVHEDDPESRDEAWLLHLYNWQAQTGGHLLLTSRTPPARWTVSLRDLASRVASMPTVSLGAPDDALLQALLVKLFHDRQLPIDQGVVTYAVPRLERSFAAVQRFVAAADRQALASRRRITVPLARDVLDRIAAVTEE